MAIDSSVKKFLEGKTIVRGKISLSIVLGQILEKINYTPKSLFNESSLDSIFYKLSKIDSLLGQLTVGKNYKIEIYKKAISQLALDKTKSEHNSAIISQFIEDIENSAIDLREKISKEMLEIKEDFQLFIQTDLSKAEKLRAIKEVIDNFSEIVEEHLRKERLVSTPFGKFGVKVNKRFGTKGVYFEVNSELKKYLHDNSDKNVLEIEKQRKTINKNLVSKKKYLDRHKPKQKEDE